MHLHRRSCAFITALWLLIGSPLLAARGPDSPGEPGSQVEVEPAGTAAGHPAGPVTYEQLVALVALDHLQRKPALKREDCSGFVESVLARAGVPRTGSVRIFWERAVAEGRAYRGGMPRPGHLAFFDTTYDANGNGKVDDPLTHMGIVYAVNEEGTIEMVHRSRGGISALHLHLGSPGVHKRDEELLNDYLRKPGYGPPGERRLTGELLYGFAAPPVPYPPNCDCVCAPLTLPEKLAANGS